MIKRSKNKSAFTLIELLVVIAIIGILATVVIVVFSGTRVSSRDTARLSDVNRIQTALNLYWQAAGVYPDEVSSGNSIEYNGAIFMDPVPFPPEPTDDGDCTLLTGEDFTYKYTKVGGGGTMSYKIEFCLGSGGDHIATPHGITVAPSE